MKVRNKSMIELSRLAKNFQAMLLTNIKHKIFPTLMLWSILLSLLKVIIAPHFQYKELGLNMDNK